MCSVGCSAPHLVSMAQETHITSHRHRFGSSTDATVECQIASCTSPKYLWPRYLPRPSSMCNRGDRIRTSDLLVPNETRYQAALHPGIWVQIPMSTISWVPFAREHVCRVHTASFASSALIRESWADRVHVVIDCRRITVRARGVKVWTGAGW